MAVQDPGVILAFRCHFKHLLGVVREIEQQIIDSDIHAIELIGDREAVGHDRSELFIRSHELGIDDLNRHKTLEKFAVDRPAVLQNSVVNVITQGAQCFLVIKDGVIIHSSIGDHDQIVSILPGRGKSVNEIKFFRAGIGGKSCGCGLIRGFFNNFCSGGVFRPGHSGPVSSGLISFRSANFDVSSVIF